MPHQRAVKTGETMEKRIFKSKTGLTKKLLISFVGMLGVGLVHADNPFTTDDQIGGMSLEENFKIAEKAPMPSAWLLSSTCAACHGTYGQEFNDIIPPLAGMPAKDFVKKMTEYKTKDWHNFIAMGIMAQPFTDNEIKAMGEFFAKQEPVEWTQEDWNKDIVIPDWAKTEDKSNEK